jgi:hypothetical protein
MSAAKHRGHPRSTSSWNVTVTKDHELTVTAGETLEPTSTYLE